MSTNSTLNISAYAGNIILPPGLKQNMSAIQSAGFTSLIVDLFHVDLDGSINFNGTTQPIIKNGVYIGPAQWPTQLAQLKSGGTIQTLLASFGGWDDVFYTIQKIYNANGGSFNGTQLQANAAVFRKTFPAFDIIDMDVEYPKGPPANAANCVVAFCQMWIEAGFDITFCPFQDTGFWTGCLASLENTNPGAVKWWNLQCYAGGNGNNPQDWADAITRALPNFNTGNYILASDWTPFWDINQWQGDCPAPFQKLLSAFKGQACVGGAFVWNIDQIFAYPAAIKIHPWSNACKQMSMVAYVNAIKNALQ